jgi:hypothetical protein
LDDLPGFTPANPRLQYLSWNLRELYASFHAANPGAFPYSYPLRPEVATGGGVYEQSGTLRAGSGPHVLVPQADGAEPVDLRFSASGGDEPITSAVRPRIALVRIR